MQNIVLVGFMGTGKTTVGNILAEKTGMPLVDMDHLIEERSGKTINDIFAEDGEPAFRALERDLSKELSAQEGQIISTGGGIVLNPDNISDYEKTGLVVCLIACATTILERVQNDSTRPLLAGDKAAKIVELLKTRMPLYEAIPYKIDTDACLSADQVASEIIKLYQSKNS